MMEKCEKKVFPSGNDVKEMAQQECVGSEPIADVRR